MKYTSRFVLLLFFAGALTATTLFFIREKQSDDPVINFVRAHVKGPRRRTFPKAIELSNQRQIKTIVETGTSRGGTLAYDGDGGFTIIFGYWSQLHNAELYSVDIDPKAIERAHSVVDKYGEIVHLVEDDSVHFLQHFNKTIDFLYLDSYDFDKNNPHPSQLHHLHEIEAAYNKLAPHSIVMIDDCGLAYGGKGKLVVDYLLNKGWSIYAQDYQIIMVHS